MWTIDFLHTGTHVSTFSIPFLTESESDADKNRELVKKFDDAIYYGKLLIPCYRMDVNKFFWIFFIVLILGNVTELQSLFDSGARINYDEFHALHSAVSLYSDGSMFEHI